MSSLATTDSYLSTFSGPQAALLQDMRRRLRLLLPEAQEVISYGIPGLKMAGSVIAGYAAWKQFGSLYPHSGGILPLFSDEIAALGLTRTKSALHFTPDRPIPDELLSRIIAARRAEAGLA